MTEGRRFELVRELGSGTFGTVYLADMVSLGGFRKRVALKMLNPQWEDGSDAGRRLRDEARLLGRLRHRHIVAVDDLVRVNGRWGVVMEYVPGVDLERLIVGARNKGTTIPRGPALEITIAVAEALRIAYDGGRDSEALQVVHRDIKPSNVLLTPEGDVKVLDFGIASASFQGREAKTGRVRFGSIPYMSPERVLGEPEIPAGDVYALGCVLFELLSGRRLGRAELGPDQQAEQVATALSLLRQQQEDAPEALFTLLDDCLKYAVDDRPSASEVSSRARTILREVSSDGLHAFSEHFVPALLEEISQPTAHGVFSEEMTPSVAAPSNPTLVLADDLMAEEPEPAPAPAPAAAPLPPAPAASTASTSQSRGPMLMIAAGLIGLLVTGGLGGLWVLQNSGEPDAVEAPAEEPTTTTAPVEAPPAEAPPAEAPPAEAPPVEEPPAEEPPAEEPAVEERLAEEPAEQPAAPTPASTKPPPAEEPAEEPAAEAVAVAEPVEDAPRLRAVKFAAPAGATAITARCGDVSGQGTGSVNLRNIPAGACSVTATVDGASATTTLTVDRPAGFSCTLDGGALKCQ